MDVLQPILPKSQCKEFNSTLRKLRHRLGPLRDLDVMIDLAGAKPARAAMKPAADWTIRLLNQQRERQREKAGKKIDIGKMLSRLEGWQAVRAEMLASALAVDSLLAESLHLQLDAFHRACRWCFGAACCRGNCRAARSA